MVMKRSRPLVELVSQGHDPGGPLLPGRPTWQDRAACDGSKDPVFFPDNESARTAAEAERLYCRACPVQVECLGSALRNNDTGVWAGTTRDMRRKLARIRDRAKCPKCECKVLISVETHDLCTACGVSWRVERKTSQEQDERDDDEQRSA